MPVSERAISLNKEGFNCAQCTIAAMEEYIGLDVNTLLAVSGGFGGGVRCGQICGAISGAVMALGLCKPFIDANDEDSKNLIAQNTKTFTADFKEHFGAICCDELKRNYETCDDLIKYAVEHIEQIIKGE